MMKQEKRNKIHIEFGSDIDINDNVKHIKERTNKKWLNNSYLFRSGRDTLKYIAKKHSKSHKRILMPIPCCDSMVKPFELYNYSVIYYPLINDYTIDYAYIKKVIKDNDLLLIENYFGLKTEKGIKKETNLVNKLKNNLNNLIVIQDYTQSLSQALYANKQEDDYYIFSCRKWCGLPDGGILWSKDKIKVDYDDYNQKYFDLRKEAMTLKSIYLNNEDANLKNRFLKLFKEAENLLDEDNKIIEMSDYSKKILFSIDFLEILQIRKNNIKYFEKLINNKLSANKHFIKALSVGTNCSGQFFPIYVENQIELQKYLATNNIYCPIMWPSLLDEISSDFIFVNDLITHILAIPCDQRYNLEEIGYIIDILVSYYKDKDEKN